VHRLASDGELPPRARQAITSLKALGQHAPPTEYVAPDVEFHTALAGHIESERVTRMHNALMQEMHFCMAQIQVHDLLSPFQIVLEHERIADAIEASDPGGATRELQLHLERARDALIGFLDASGEGDGGAARHRH
jgi:DNA-binding FadR family transcriptional regulator